MTETAIVRFNLDMDEAPKDGQRILLLHTPQHYIDGVWTSVGTKAEEARWVKDHWEPWCGNSQTHSTNSLIPLGWMWLQFGI